MTAIDYWIIGLVAVLGILDSWRQHRKHARADRCVTCYRPH